MKKSEYKTMHLVEDSHFWFIGKRLFINAYLKEVESNIKKILDVGCGTGGTTIFLEKFGDVIGLENNVYAASFAAIKGLRIIKGNAENLPFKNNSFDLVTIFDVLYHKNIKDVDLAVSEIRKVLKPDGYLLITDSAFNFLKSHHGAEVYEKRRFTLKELREILNKNAFTVIKSSYIYLTILPLILGKRLLLDRLVKPKSSDLFMLPKWINRLLINLLNFESFLLNYISFPVGSSLIILSQKNE